MLAVGLGGAAAATLQGCDPHGADDADDGGGADGTDGSCNGGGGDTGGGSGGDAPGATCSFVPEQGPALLDFGRCETMATGEVLGACGNTGVHRRCDAAFLEWCNEQGGDVTACDEDQVFDAQPTALCGTGPNAIACDLPFEDNCDSLDGTFVCFNRDCTIASCTVPPVLADVALCCEAVDDNGVLIDCTTNATTPAEVFDMCMKPIKVLCKGNVGCNENNCSCE